MTYKLIHYEKKSHQNFKNIIVFIKYWSLAVTICYAFLCLPYFSNLKWPERDAIFFTGKTYM